MTERKLQALRNLAERPGTEAEGKLARELLAKHESEKPDAGEIGEEKGSWWTTGDPYVAQVARDMAHTPNGNMNASDQSDFESFVNQMAESLGARARAGTANATFTYSWNQGDSETTKT